jgi:hypothetical protein
MCNTPVEVQFMTSAGCLNYPCRTPLVDILKPGLDFIDALALASWRALAPTLDL